MLLLAVAATVAGSLWLVVESQRAAAAACILAIGAGYLLLLREWRRIDARHATELAHREAQRELVEALQATRSEAEAHEIVRRHLERTTPAADVTVINRGSGATRSNAATLEPQACLAIRLGRIHEQQAARPPLLPCAVCGESTRASVCVPSQVGGEVTGAVLVQRSDDGELDDDARSRVKESVGQAAPVLANLRNLAIAELRAATDALTGLPNSPALRGALKRMVAQAGRTVTPFSAILIDLDHFKRINETHGHDRGDDAIAAVGETLASTVRASDYAGRYGGEEFLVLLPNTDREGAMLVAEKLRRAIGGIVLPGLERPLSASLGVASLPADGGDGDALMRLTDRALHAAKAAGRNRVEAAGLSVAGSVHD